MKKLNIPFDILVHDQKKRVRAIGVKTFTLQGEKFIIHRKYYDKKFISSLWGISHFNTGIGGGVSEMTIEKVIRGLKDKVKKYRASIPTVVSKFIHINNPKKIFPCLNCQELNFMSFIITQCPDSVTMPHKRKRICNQFKERS
jgi:hypothetical protein